MENLKPCPFCGTKQSDVNEVNMPMLEFAFTEHPDEKAKVACRKCEIYGPEDITESLAAKAWNKRAKPPTNSRPDDAYWKPYEQKG